MDISHILDHLNDKQREAVTAPAGNYLVLAGAGSGKTRVLVHRIAWLLQVEHVSVHAILAVTFTNKAAAEMRGRIENLLGLPTRGMWVGTFHSLAHRLLRAHWQAAGLPENFQILDSEDQYRLIRRVLKSLNIDEEKFQPRKVQWFINSNKDEGLRPHQLDKKVDDYSKSLIRIYEAYEQACQQSGLVDFAELLLRSHEIWLKNPEILRHYQQRFSHILVDEFQDTNTIQYAWIKVLAGQSAHLMAVGDDDQSIYGWRGARIENIHRLSRDFANTMTIRLEQNYRSTGNILNAANALIANNDDRLGKNLWTEGNEGEPIALYAALNEIDEARYIVEQIQQAVSSGHAYRDLAILYRSNAQSRVIEEALIQAGMPYRVYGGLRFFDRAEIKDALAYLRLIANRHDDTAIERIINMPTRGIGEKTLSVIRQVAREQQCSLWTAAITVLNENALPARASAAVTGFIQLIDTLAESTEGLELDELTEETIESSGLLAHYEKSKGEKAQSKVENLQELVAACKQFEMDEDDDMPLLAAFISHAALESGEKQGQAFQDNVQLMTLHSAKGLEFPIVFLAGVEEGLFPHKMALQEEGRLAEERRLCYVGMTRAMEKLYISYAEIRRQFGTEEFHTPSRFIAEIPEHNLQAVRLKTKISSPVSYAHDLDFEIDEQPLQLGQVVHHAKFGDGIIVNYEGHGASARVQVQFHQHGTKWLVLQYANLTLA